ncbi:MAG: biopolymer transporter ExbD [Rhodocyclales bacterium]|nr:biopolymer transporter ExbD [Rhodocyclales bacterium]
MAFGGFNKQGNTAPMAEINMVPLIDVMLVLLVIFILTAPLLTHAVKVDLPKASSAENKHMPNKIEIAVDGAGTLFWDGEAVAEATLNARLLAAGKAVSDPAQAPELQFRFDRTTPYETVARIMAASARAGLTKLGFVSTPQQ